MAKGDGSITEVRRGVWRVCVSFGKDPITGKRLKVQRNVKGTKADARKVRDQIQREHEQGVIIESEKLTFSEFARQWNEFRDGQNLATRTRERERGIVSVFCEYLGETRLKDIAPQTVESLYTAIRRDRGITSTTLCNYHQMLSQMLDKAERYGLIVRNPCSRVDAPRRESVNRRSLSRAEAAQLLAKVSEAESDAYEADEAKERRQIAHGNAEGRLYVRDVTNIARPLAVRVALATGARLGETLALTWGCVNLGKGVITVSASINKLGEIKEPKTKAGYRRIAIDAQTVAALARWREYQRGALARLSLEATGETPVFTDSKGDYIDPCNFERWWRVFRDNAGFPGLKFHELRHTQASLLLANGVDVKTVQSRMGHSNASVTLNFYAHAMPENDRAAADLLGSLCASDKPRIIKLTA